MLARETNSNSEHNGEALLDLLRLFRAAHNSSFEELAGLLRVTPGTLEEWFSEGMTPPASCLAFALLFDTRAQMPHERHFSCETG